MPMPDVLAMLWVWIAVFSEPHLHLTVRATVFDSEGAVGAGEGVILRTVDPVPDVDFDPRQWLPLLVHDDPGELVGLHVLRPFDAREGRHANLRHAVLPDE